MSDRTYLSGTSLAGMSPSRSRVKDDFYATLCNRGYLGQGTVAWFNLGACGW